MHIRKLVLYSLLASVGALGCKNSNNKPEIQPSPPAIKRAAQPGIIPVEGPLEKEDFQNLSTAYLLAACEGDPFAKKYAPLADKEGQGLPEDIQQALQALIKYVRKGGEGEAAITKSMNVLKEHPFGSQMLDLWSPHPIPATIRRSYSNECFIKVSRPSLIFIYEVRDHNPNGPQLLLSTLFAERNTTNSLPTDVDAKSKSAPVPLHKLVFFTDPPQNIGIMLAYPMREKDVIVSLTLTLPAACTGQGQAIDYELIGVLREPGYYSQKASTRMDKDKLEGLTYFRWGNQWYKITSNAPTPEKTTEKEAQEAAASSGYVSNAFRYLYTRKAEPS